MGTDKRLARSMLGVGCALIIGAPLLGLASCMAAASDSSPEPQRTGRQHGTPSPAAPSAGSQGTSQEAPGDEPAARAVRKRPVPGRPAARPGGRAIPRR